MWAALKWIADVVINVIQWAYYEPTAAIAVVIAASLVAETIRAGAPSVAAVIDVATATIGAAAIAGAIVKPFVEWISPFWQRIADLPDAAVRHANSIWSLIWGTLTFQW